MLPFAIGLSTAFGFALLTGSVYGMDVLLSEPWSLSVLWGLVVGSGMMSLAGPNGGAWLSRMGRYLGRDGQSGPRAVGR
jgi:hypothetical protein